jgi:16S rRNA C1402 (ribose-2'-O) methylase RsmI
MLKLSKEKKEVSQKEQDVLSLENRKSQAEGEFLIILEDKKRVSSELEKIEETIKEKKVTINNSNT